MVSLHIPLDGFHADGADSGNDMVVVLAERAADERRADAGERLDLVAAGVHVRDDLVGGQGIVVVVRVGVVHQLVAALDDGLGLLRVLVRPVADDEEGTLHTVVREHIENLLRVVRTPGGVERDAAHLLIALDAVDGQLPRRGRRPHGGGRVHRAEDGERRQQRRTDGQRPAPQNKKARLRRLPLPTLFPQGKLQKHPHILPILFW